MKKIILSVMIMLLFCAQASHCATWYACADQEITAAGTFKDDAACTGATLTWADVANGDVLISNGRTVSIANDIGSAILSMTLSATSTGGYYTYNTTAVTGKILYANITNDQSGQGLFISGSGDANPVLTINGSVTGGSTSGDYGIFDTHTVGRVVINGTVTGGTNSSAYGYRYSGATERATDITACVGDTAEGCQTISTGTIYVTTCTGDNDSAAAGCYGALTGPVVVTGNIVNTPYASGVRGSYIWQPTSAQNYIKIWAGGANYIYASSGLGSNAGGTQISTADTAANVKAGSYFIKKDDGAYTIGTAAGGGSVCAW